MDQSQLKSDQEESHEKRKKNFSLSMNVGHSCYIRTVLASNPEGLEIQPGQQIITIIHGKMPKVKHQDLKIYLSDDLIVNQIELGFPMFRYYDEKFEFMIENNSNKKYTIPFAKPIAIMCARNVTERSIQHLPILTRLKMYAIFKFHKVAVIH
jgi:hypothetical protein